MFPYGHPIHSPAGPYRWRLHCGTARPSPNITPSGASTWLQAHSKPLLSLEQALTAVGLVMAGAALLCLMAFGVGWSSSWDVLEMWLGMAVCGAPLGVWIHRAIRPLFWL